MKINDEQLGQFIEIYEKEFGETIEKEQALDAAIRLLTLFEIIMRPLPPEMEAEIKRQEEESQY